MQRQASRGMAKNEVWIAARRKLPAYVGEGEEAYRPTVLLWLDAVLECVVGVELVQGDGHRELIDLFHRATNKPMLGPPRRPTRIRVEDRELAGVLSDALGNSIPIEVGAAPQVEAVMSGLFEHLGAVAAQLPEPRVGYLEGARLEAPLVEKLFAAAALLFEAAPWKSMSDSELLAVDIPELGVEDGCMSVVGALGETLGLLLFSSLAAFDAFAEAADDDDLENVDYGTDFLSLRFGPLTELAPAVRRECAREKWQLAAPDAYPMVERRDRNAFPMPLVERDVRIAMACAAALATFFSAQREALAAGEPASMTIETEAGPPVRLTFPYEAKELFEAEPGAQRRTAPDAAHGGHQRGRHPVHDLDERMVGLLRAYAARRFGRRMNRALRLFGQHGPIEQIALPWSVYVAEFDGQRVVDWFLSERASQLSREERAWLEAQRGAWLSVWKVEEVEAERGIWVRDALSGLRCFVQEVAGSRSVGPAHHVLARVIEHDGVHVFCGIHPRMLDAVNALKVIGRARRHLRAQGAVPPERLRALETSRALVRYWEEAFAPIDARRGQLPKMVNRHGDELLWTSDHFSIATGGRAAIERALAELDPEARQEKNETVFRVFSDPSLDAVLLGTVTVTDSRVRIESNSKRRADELRERVEALSGDRLGHVGRTHSDPLASVSAGTPRPAMAEVEMGPEALSAIRAFKARHYATWPDQALPALDGKTPRSAVKTRSGRALVSALLDDIERFERTQPAGSAHDFSTLRRELGLVDRPVP